MKTSDDLRKLLLTIDRRSYPAYKDTRGQWSYAGYTLSIDHVQGDPFASPSSVSVIVPGLTALFPADYLLPKHRRLALQDMLLRFFSRELSKRASERQRVTGSDRSSTEYYRAADRGRDHGAPQRDGSGKSGLIAVSRPGQEVLERTACRVDPHTGDVTLRFEIGFPANGRTINAKALIRILDDFLPNAVAASLFYRNVDKKKLQEAIDLSDDQQYIREVLEKKGLCAFVGDGAVLPRESGVSSQPLKDAVPFLSPESMAVTLDLPHAGPVRGMGIPRGVTLIVGGGYHGKSTLLNALEKGVYNHILGDGREYVITDGTAAKIRAEDGRSITNVDISLFIRDLPGGQDTVRFSSQDASGSTSQAANVIEAVEAGARLLLIDEDTSATNFMVRDELMARVVSKNKEPITPFISRMWYRWTATSRSRSRRPQKPHCAKGTDPLTQHRIRKLLQAVPPLPPAKMLQAVPPLPLTKLLPTWPRRHQPTPPSTARRTSASPPRSAFRAETAPSFAKDASRSKHCPKTASSSPTTRSTCAGWSSLSTASRSRPSRSSSNTRSFI